MFSKKFRNFCKGTFVVVLTTAACVAILYGLRFLIVEAIPWMQSHPWRPFSSMSQYVSESEYATFVFIISILGCIAFGILYAGLLCILSDKQDRLSPNGDRKTPEGQEQP